MRSFFTTNRILFVHFILLLSISARAQHPSTQSEIVVQVMGLTSAERDAINRDLRSDQAIQLVYACVPAGLLVFKSRVAMQASELLAATLSVARERVNAARIAPTELQRAHAEAQCAAQR